MPKKTKTKAKVFNTNCCVRECHSRRSKDKSIHFHHFPRQGTSIVQISNDDGVVENIDRKKAWEKILLREKPASKALCVCSLHFKPEDYHTRESVQPRLRRSAVPSLKLPTKESLINIDKDNKPTVTKTQSWLRKSRTDSNKINESPLQPIVEIYLCCDVNIKEEVDSDIELVEPS